MGIRQIIQKFFAGKKGKQKPKSIMVCGVSIPPEALHREFLNKSFGAEMGVALSIKKGKD